MLVDELYTIAEIGADVAKIRLSADSAIYKAHFPGNPVTPGVCQVGIVEELAERICGAGLRLCEVKTLKFTDILRPSEEEVEVRFDKLEEDGDVVAVKGAVVAGNRVFTKFSLLFDKES